MMACPCGSDWFVEHKLVRPAGLPHNPHSPMPVREQPKYRYVCVECDLEYGKEPEKPRRRKRQSTSN